MSTASERLSAVAAEIERQHQISLAEATAMEALAVEVLDIAASLPDDEPPPPPEPEPEPVWTPPDTIDKTGAADVTNDLLGWLAGVPDGTPSKPTQIELPADAQYRCEGTLWLDHRKHLVVNGNGALVFATTNGNGVAPPPGPGEGHLWPRRRSHIALNLCEDIAITDLRITGSNSEAGCSGPYEPSLEAQMGVSIQCCDTVTVSRCTIRNVWGDTVYVGGAYGAPGSKNVAITDCQLGPTGRQGIAVCWGDDVLIARNTLTGVRRSAFDLEPAGSHWSVHRVTIADNTVHSRRLTFVACLGKGPVDDIEILRNTCLDTVGPNTSRVISVVVKAGDGTRRKHWRVEGNVGHGAAQGPLALMRFVNVDGVVVTGNVQPIMGQYPPGVGNVYSGVAVKTECCTNVQTAGNTWTRVESPGGPTGPLTDWIDVPCPPPVTGGSSGGNVSAVR